MKYLSYESERRDSVTIGFFLIKVVHEWCTIISMWLTEKYHQSQKYKATRLFLVSFLLTIAVLMMLTCLMILFNRHTHFKDKTVCEEA